jgi:hypothetical protein
MKFFTFPNLFPEILAIPGPVVIAARKLVVPKRQFEGVVFSTIFSILFYLGSIQLSRHFFVLSGVFQTGDSFIYTKTTK